MRGASAGHLGKREISVFLEPTPSAVGLVATRPTWLHTPWRDSTQVNRQVITKWARERTSLFPWDYISLGLGWTKCILKMTNQIPKLPWVLEEPTSQPIPSFLPQARLTGLFGLAPPPVSC